MSVQEADNPTPRVFCRRRSGRVQIGLEALSTLLRYRQLTDDAHESGGVLLGRYIRDSDDIVIDKVTTPQPEDRSSRSRFFRSRKQHQELIDEAWSTSKETTAYLGEWHTHPEAGPNPSMIDRIGWQKKLLFDHSSEAIFFIIVGTKDIRIWEGRSRFSNVVRLAEVPDVDHKHPR